MKFSGAILTQGLVIGQPADKQAGSNKGKHCAYGLADGSVSWPFSNSLRASSYIGLIIVGKTLYAFKNAGIKGHPWGRSWVPDQQA